MNIDNDDVEEITDLSDFHLKNISKEFSMKNDRLKVIEKYIIDTDKIILDNTEKLEKLKAKISLLVGRLINKRDDERIGITVSEIISIVESMNDTRPIAEKACALTFLKQFDDKDDKDETN